MKIRNSICGLVLIPLLFICFALLPRVQAVVPAPDGFYPGFNTAEGQFSLLNLNTAAGLGNTAVGFAALKFLTTGDNNTAVGVNALLFDTTASQNTAVGQGALQRNNGNFNTATGFQALAGNTIGFQNTADGWGALQSNLNGIDNVASGFQALNNNDSGSFNTASGFQALFANDNGSENTAIGPGALFANSDGIRNTAVGASFVLFNNDHGSNNTAVGNFALANNVGAAANFNTAVGAGALFNNTSGNLNTAVGINAGQGVSNGTGIVCVGWNQFSDNVSNRTFIKNVGSTVQPFSAGVIDFVTVNISNNKMGRNGSSRRYKEDIKPMDKSSELIYQLKPATYRLKKTDEYPNPVQDYGLIAEDVAEVAPELAIINEDGTPESVRYLAIQTLMLNEFLKEHKTVQEQGATIARQQKQIEALTAGLQKVSAQLEVSKSAPKTVANK